MKSKIYLPGLNGLRAIAAMSVVFSHINQDLQYFSLPSKGTLQLASFGVTIFFTLSGFLITYLLLREQDETGDIDIPKFYIRRILRIWPLYFLYLGIALAHNLVVREHLSWNELIYYVLFIPNVPFILGTTIHLLAHYWSLGVEEQFYAFWPWLIRRIQNLALFLSLFVVGFIVLKLAAKFLDSTNRTYAFLHYTRFGCMAIGALGAYFYLKNASYIRRLTHWSVEGLSWGLLVLISINLFHIFSIIDHEIVAVATVILIINQVNNPKPLISLEKAPLNYLGKISFGLYVYNPWLIEISAYLFKPISSVDVAFRYAFAYLFVPALVILVSQISYSYFEQRFLMVKENFAVIKTSAKKIV